MLNDYECPRCHNIFPSSNKMLHDIKCTSSKPVPLNASRIIFNNRRNVIPKKKNNYNNQINYSSSDDFPNVFYCDICHQSMLEKEKDDHMLCHNLENEENEEKNMINQNINNYDNFQQQQRNERNNRRMRQNQNRVNNNNQNRIRYRQNNNNHHQNIRANRQRNNNNQFNNRNNNNNNNHVYRYLSSRSNPRQRNNNNNQHGRINENIIYNNLFNEDEFNDFANFNNQFDEFEADFPYDDEENKYLNPTENQIIDGLPENRIEDTNKLDQEKKNCVICLEDFKNGDTVINLPCIHLFHNNCIKNWLKSQNSCPVCKFKLTEENINS